MNKKSSSLLGVPKKAGNLVRKLFITNKDGKTTDLNENLLSDDEKNINNDNIQSKNNELINNNLPNNKKQVRINEIEMDKKVSFNHKNIEKQQSITNVTTTTTTNPLNKNNKKSGNVDNKEGYTWDFCLVLPNPEFEEFIDLKSGEGF